MTTIGLSSNELWSELSQAAAAAAEPEVVYEAASLRWGSLKTIVFLQQQCRDWLFSPQPLQFLVKFAEDEWALRFQGDWREEKAM